MGIQKCENCGYQFTWKEIQKAIRWTYKPLVCRKCGTRHFISMKTRLVLPLLIGPLVFILTIIKVPFYLGIVLTVTLPLIVILLFPYFAKYKTKNKN
jgi:CXXC-20-CXXC protein